MKRTSIAVFVCVVAVCGLVRADDNDATKNCVAAWTTSCSKDCGTARCVSECTKQAMQMCEKDVTKPQQVFVGPVIALPLATNECPGASQAPQCTPFPVNGSPAAAPPSCSTVSGTVAARQFWGGLVTIYVICPPFSPAGHENSTPTTTVLGHAPSSPTDGKFSMNVTNTCSGQTGCYGLIVVTPPACEGCAPNPDPGWNTCTSSACPNP